ncbi:Hypothetical protein D9617_2g054520 [Elsinoe fawcettii]|nr:Hypothetical protein D9617_2g054520 [Elsinoe fawcettii]
MLGAILLNAMPWIVLLSECKPIRAHWDYEAGTCWQSRSKTYIIYASIGYNVTTDLICASLPVIAVWNLHLKRSRKLLIYGLVLLGLIATGCAVGRATALSLDPMDYTWTYCIAALWSNTKQQTIQLDNLQNLYNHQPIDAHVSSWPYLDSFYNTNDTTLDSLFPPTQFDAPTTTMSELMTLNTTSHISMELHDQDFDFAIPMPTSTSSTSPNLRTTSGSMASGLSSPSSTSASSNRKRPAEAAVDESLADKRRRNNAAAAKYRQKKVDRITTLEEEVRDVSKERDELRIQLARRDAEIEVLRGLLKKG